MWTKTTKKFRRNKASNKACDADLDICKNNSLPVSGEEFAIVGKTPSADDASSMMMLKEMTTDRECDAQQPDVCKNNSSSTESQMTMSHGPSTSGEEGRDDIVQMLDEIAQMPSHGPNASGEEERDEIAQMPSRGSDEFESDEEGDDETLSAEEAVVDGVNDEGITVESPSVNDNGAEPTSEVAAEPNDTTPANDDIAKCTSMCRSLENMMHERVSSINQIRMILRDEIQADNGKSSSLNIFCLILNPSH
eukprot:scaffold1230_cov97-Skeletonema_dohrnii-CCMP3373.AAC.5